MEYSFQFLYLCIVNKKTDILKAALKLFVEQGEQATSMKWVAKEAKCGIGTMYNYFPSKDDLFCELYYELKSKMFVYISENLDKSSPVKMQFIDSWFKLLDFTKLFPLEYKFIEMYAHSPRITDEYKQKIDALCSFVSDIYERGKREGVIKNYDTKQLINFTNSAIIGSIINNPDIDENKKKEIILMAWDAIKS